MNNNTDTQTTTPWIGLCESCDAYSTNLVPVESDGERFLVCDECA